MNRWFCPLDPGGALVGAAHRPAWRAAHGPGPDLSSLAQELTTSVPTRVMSVNSSVCTSAVTRQFPANGIVNPGDK